MKKQKKQFRKPRRFPEGVARFFNPQKCSEILQSAKEWY